MTALAHQQQALLEALFTQPGVCPALDAWLQPHTERGLMAYRANGHALAERSLRATYPVIAELLGDENLAPLARELWHQHPPTRGDLAHWGDALPGFLRQHPQLTDLPYLADVAHIEWALHRAAGAPDADLDTASFARLSSEDPQHLALRLAPGTAVFTSPWPVASLVGAHRPTDADLHGDTPPSLQQAAERLRDGVGESAVVWRQGLRPCMRACTRAEATLLQATLGGASLPEALDAIASQDHELDLATWLAQAVQQGLLLGVIDAHPAASHTPSPHKETP
jgi:hypothetical protein